MLGIPTDARKPLLQLYQVGRALPHIHLPTLLVTIVSLATIFLLKRFAPRFPGSLLVVVGATAASAIWDFAGHGISIIGPVVGGLPRLSFPDVHWQDVPALVSVAASCTVMILTQSAATSRIYAGRHRGRLDSDKDIVGLSAANAASAFTGTFVVNGSPTQTALLESCGSQSQFAQVTTAAIVAIVLLFLTKPIQYLPHCVLGALVFLVALHLIDLRALQAILPESRPEYALALTTAIFVVVAGVEEGILLAMVMSLLRIVHHSYHPRSGVMIAEADGTW